MKHILFYIILFSFFCSCHSAKQHSDADIPVKFEKTKWLVKEADDYPYRSYMMEDLINNQKLKGLKKNELIDFLGQPDRTDSNYLFYRITQKRIGIFP